MTTFKAGDQVEVIQGSGSSINGFHNPVLTNGAIHTVGEYTRNGCVRLVGLPHPDGPLYDGWNADRFKLHKSATASLESTYIPLAGQLVKPGDRVRAKSTNLNDCLRKLIEEHGTYIFTVKNIDGYGRAIKINDYDSQIIRLNEFSGEQRDTGWFASRFELEVLPEGIATTPATTRVAIPSEKQRILSALMKVPDPKKEPLEASKALGLIIDTLQEELAATAPTTSSLKPVASGGIVAPQKPVPVTTNNWRVGLRVVRGPNWSYHDQDKFEGNTGTITKLNDGLSGWVEVKWDDGATNNYPCIIGRETLASYEL